MFQRFMRSPLSTTERKHLCPKRQILYPSVCELSAFANRNHYPPRVLYEFHCFQLYVGSTEP